MFFSMSYKQLQHIFTKNLLKIYDGTDPLNEN